MKRLVFFFLVCVFAFSCQKKHAKVNNKPDWVLDEKVMVDIITDLRITEAATYINTGAPPRDKVKDWKFVMKKYHTNDTLFRNSHDYYAEHPEVMVKIYEKVIDNISEMEVSNSGGQ